MKSIFSFSTLSIMAVPPLVTHIGFLVLGFLGHELWVPSRTVSWTQKIGTVKNSFILPLTQMPQFLVANNKNKMLYIARKKNSRNEEFCYVYSGAVRYITLPGNTLFLILPIAMLKTAEDLAQKLQSKGENFWSLVAEKPREQCPWGDEEVIYGS